MIELHAGLWKQKIPTYIFSNTNEIAVGHIRRSFPFFTAFDGYILSYEVGAMKPGPKIYEALEKNDSEHLNYFVAGPWNHGGWAHGDGSALGKIQFGSETSNGAFALSAGMGSNSNDISPSGQFPFYTGSAATPLFYVAIESNASVTFSQTPAITVTATSLPGSQCSLFIYANTGGSAYQWVQVPNTTVSGFGNNFTIPPASPVGTNLNIPANQTQLAFVGC